MDHAFCKHPEGAQALLALKDDITDINLPGIYQYYVEGAIREFGCFKATLIIDSLGRRNIDGCFFHSFCATDLNFGTKNIGRMK